MALAHLAVVAAAGVGLGVEQPEGHVNALNLGDVVLALERLGQEGFALIIFGQLGDGGVLVHLEGQDVFGLQLARKLAAQHGGVAAVGAGGGRRGGVADQLRAAGGAGVAGKAAGLRFAPDRVFAGRFCAVGRSLLLVGSGGRVGFLLFLGVLGLDVGDLIGRAAVVAHQLAGGAVEVQRAGTGRALVVRYFISHG